MRLRPEMRQKSLAFCSVGQKMLMGEMSLSQQLINGNVSMAAGEAERECRRVDRYIEDSEK